VRVVAWRFPVVVRADEPVLANLVLRDEPPEVPVDARLFDPVPD